MSAPLSSLSDHSVLVQTASQERDSLSVDLREAGADLIVQEQCCRKVSAADIVVALEINETQGRKAREKRKAKAKLKPKNGFWPCGHAETFADFGSCYTCERENPPVDRELSRRRIDRRQRAAQRLLVGIAPLSCDERIEAARKWAPTGDLKKVWKSFRRAHWYPVTACGIVPIDLGMSLEQWSSGKVDRHGVFRCGSVWTCPSCSQRVAVTRSSEIRDVQIKIDDAGGITVMITWTIPHDRETPLAVSMDRLKKAFHFFRQDKRIWNHLIEKCGYMGHVTSTEITLALKMDPLDPLTFFDNGWHCHAHSMMGFKFDGARSMNLIEEGAFSVMLKDLMFCGWARAVLKAGAPRAPSYEYGFDVRPAWSATTYIQKMEEVNDHDAPTKKRWGIEAELTKSYMKEGRKKSRTPFELLDSDDPKDHELFRTYARASFGRSQIEWSRGKWNLRLLLDDPTAISDEEAASQPPKWDFADEYRSNDDHVVEQVFIARDDCWRARKAGKNAMARAIADVDGGGCESLEQALRENGFVVIRVEEAYVKSRLVFDENMEQVSEQRWVWVGDDEKEWTELQWCDVTEEVHIPKMVWVTFPDRKTPDALVDQSTAISIVPDDLPY